MTPEKSSSGPSELSLVAPVDGVVVALEELPDPVFAGKLLGEGLSIDPTSNVVVAPCDGLVLQLHRAHHALTIKSPLGICILVHIGLDTVKLNGKGFSPLVSEGAVVHQGQALIEFDMRVVADSALSAQVEVVVTEGGGTLSDLLTTGTVTAGKDRIFRIDSAAASTLARADSSTTERLSSTVTVRNPNGMHARPAAQLAQVARSFQSEIELAFGGKRASATSVSDIMSLDLQRDSELSIEASGEDAAEALRALCQAIAAGLGEDVHATPTLGEAARTQTNEPGVLGGVPASPGLAIGTVSVSTLTLPKFSRTGEGKEQEYARLQSGLELTRTALREDEARFRDAGEVEKAQIFAAHRELLDDQGLLSESRQGIEQGLSASGAFFDVVQARIDGLGGLKSALLRQRASDMKDILRRMLYAVAGQAVPFVKLSKDTILVCDELTPSMAASYSADALGGIVTELGGSTSHAAIIARTMGIAYVAGLGEDVHQLEEGMRVIVNGSAGTVQLDPSEDALRAARQEIRRLANQRSTQRKNAHQRAQTLDGFAVEVAANVGNEKDTQLALANGADGVGLLRSEFLFLHRRNAPSEAEQRKEYEGIARLLGKERSLVLRTLDVGGDKPLSYMPLPEEENPFLGVRGLRLSLQFPDLFRLQIRAALAAAEHTKLNLMFPMVSQLDEFKRAKAMALEEVDRRTSELDVAIGIMVEVPSAALNASWLAKEADFFSIGTNDLTQYTLAMDRGHPELSKQADAFDPAVLRLIAMTVEAAHAEGKWVGVCGGLAAEPLAAPLLVGLRLDELSVPAPAIPELKARICSLRQSDCLALAEGALAMPSASRVRALLQDFLTLDPRP